MRFLYMLIMFYILHINTFSSKLEINIDIKCECELSIRLARGVYATYGYKLTSDKYVVSLHGDSIHVLSDLRGLQTFLLPTY